MNEILIIQQTINFDETYSLIISVAITMHFIF